MTTTTHDPPVRSRRPREGWGLIALVAGAALLVVIALVALALGGSRPVELAPISTPEGVVQRFFDATYRGDYTSAYAMLSPAARRDLTLSEFQSRLRYERDSEMRVDAVALHAETATVTVTVTHYSPGGLFGGGEWSTQYDLLLERDGDTWRILGQPFW